MLIKPDYNLESIYDIDVVELKNKGINTLFFDLDSTLMKSKSSKFNYKTLQFLDDLKPNFKLAIITNNKNPKYIESAKSQVDIPIYSHAKKPDTKVILDACVDFMVEAKTCAIVGDRPLSDMLCGKRAGMTTILVDSISKDEESSIVRFARFLERLFIEK